jgi:hypothetical protein
MNTRQPDPKRVMRSRIRALRGWIYRRWPPFLPQVYSKRMTGYGRRWGLEETGWTQDGFCQVVWEKLLLQKKGGIILELAAGDGLVGSLGRWLEEHHGWSAECEESRVVPHQQLQKNRPRATSTRGMENLSVAKIWDVVTSRSTVRSALILRVMRVSGKRPGLLGIWNRSGRPHWARRLQRMGYRPVLCQDRMEFYQPR